MDDREPVLQLRLVLTTDDVDAAVAFYRDALGVAELQTFDDPDGRVVIYDVGHATLEISDGPHADYVDRVEGVRRGPAGASTTDRAVAAGPRLRVAFEVTDAAGVTRRLEAAGARVIAEPVRTPWGSLNARLTSPDAVELTVFEELNRERPRSDGD